MPTRSGAFGRPSTSRSSGASACSPTSTTCAAGRAREQDAARREGRRAALLPLLSVLDTLERALAVGSTDPDFYEGMAATHRQFMTALCARRGPSPSTASGNRSIRASTRRSRQSPSESVEPGRWSASCGAAGGSVTSCCVRPRSWSPRPRRPQRSVAVKFRDYYEVLGVPRTATAGGDQERLPPARAQASSRIFSRPPSAPGPPSGSRRSTRPTRS